MTALPRAPAARPSACAPLKKPARFSRRHEEAVRSTHRLCTRQRPRRRGSPGSRGPLRTLDRQGQHARARRPTLSALQVHKPPQAIPIGIRPYRTCLRPGPIALRPVPPASDRKATAPRFPRPRLRTNHSSHNNHDSHTRAKRPTLARMPSKRRARVDRKAPPPPLTLALARSLARSLSLLSLSRARLAISTTPTTPHQY